MTDDPIERGNAARALLNDPLLNEALKTIMIDVTQRWSQAQSPDEREGWWHVQNGMSLMRNYLVQVISNGEIEKDKQEKENAE